MASKLNKFLAIIAGVMGIAAIIPIDFLAWWRVDVDLGGGSKYSNFIDAIGQYHGRTGADENVTTALLENMYQVVAIVVLVGAVILLVGGIKWKKAVIVIGAVFSFLGPIVFIFAHNESNFLTQPQFLVDQNLFFGTNSIPIWDLSGSSTWYLSVGFFLPFGAGALGFLSLRRFKRGASTPSDMQDDGPSDVHYEDPSDIQDDVPIDIVDDLPIDIHIDGPSDIQDDGQSNIHLDGSSDLHDDGVK